MQNSRGTHLRLQQVQARRRQRFESLPRRFHRPAVTLEVTDSLPNQQGSEARGLNALKLRVKLTTPAEADSYRSRASQAPSHRPFSWMRLRTGDAPATEVGAGVPADGRGRPRNLQGAGTRPGKSAWTEAPARTPVPPGCRNPASGFLSLARSSYHKLDASRGGQVPVERSADPKA